MRVRPFVRIAELLGAKRARADLELAVDDPKAYVAKHAARLAERGVTRPRKDLPWIALVDALEAEQLVAEIDHRTFPEDVMDALDELRSMPKRAGRWKWAADIDEGTATDAFLGLVAHRVPLVMIDLGSDAFPVAIPKPADVRALVRLGCVAFAPREALPAAPKRPVASEAKLIAAENREPWTNVRWVIAGEHRGAETLGINYQLPYLAYRFYSEWRGRVGFVKAESFTRSGFPSRARAVSAAEQSLTDRIAKGWQRVSRERLFELDQAAKK